MKINVGVFFGGKSVEHEVSIITATQAMNAMDSNKYNVIPIYITKEGEFYTSKLMMDIENFKDIPQLLDKSTNITISVNEKEHTILNNEAGLFFKKVIDKIDVAFPIMHGTNGEDGTIQGLFELMNVAYVGSNILASSNGMDKITMKMILKETGLPVVPYLWFFSNTYFDEKETILSSIKSSLDFPVIVKPANLGSSVGIQVARNFEELEEAVDTATSYSTKIIVEAVVENLKEINVSVLGDYSEAYTSMCEEPLRSGDILSYSDKYIGENSKTGAKGMASSFSKMPAEIPNEMAAKIKAYAKMTFLSLNCSGVARVDFLINTKTLEIYVNEINTIPGSLAYYFWEKAGMPFNVLIDKLIELAVKKHKEKNKLIFTNNINILSLQKGGSKLVKQNSASDTNASHSKEENTIKRDNVQDIASQNAGSNASVMQDMTGNVMHDKKTVMTLGEIKEEYNIENISVKNTKVDEIKEYENQMQNSVRDMNYSEEKKEDEINTEIEKETETVQAFNTPKTEERHVASSEKSGLLDLITARDKNDAPKEKLSFERALGATLRAVGIKDKKENEDLSVNARDKETIGANIDITIADGEDNGEVIDVKDNNSFKEMENSVLAEFENPDVFNNSTLKIKGARKDRKEKKAKLNNFQKAVKEAALDELFAPDKRR